MPGFPIILKFCWISPNNTLPIVPHRPCQLAGGFPWNVKMIESPLCCTKVVQNLNVIIFRWIKHQRVPQIWWPTKRIFLLKPHFRFYLNQLMPELFSVLSSLLLEELFGCLHVILSSLGRPEKRHVTFDTSFFHFRFDFRFNFQQSKINIQRLLYGKLLNVLCLLFKFHHFGWNLNYLFYTLLVMVSCTNPFLTLQESDNPIFFDQKFLSRFFDRVFRRIFRIWWSLLIWPVALKSKVRLSIIRKWRFNSG